MNNNIVNLIIAVVLSVGIIFGWQHFYEKPKLAKLASQKQQYNQQLQILKSSSSQVKMESEIENVKSEDNAIDTAERVKIKTDSLSGSISLKGLRFDELTLLKYKQDLSADSLPVELLSPAWSKDAYFVELGWLKSTSDSANLPDANTTWQSDSVELTTEKDVNLTWTNPEGIRFLVNISLDENYMFTISQSVFNTSDKPLHFQYYGLINRNYNSKEKLVNILHQGPIGVIDSKLEEYSYDNIKDNKVQKFAQNKVDWLGITDKYWLSAWVPDQALSYSSNFNYAIKSGFEKFQVDFVSPTQEVLAKSESKITHHLFTGAKKVDLLDKYESKYNIKLFDRAIDFGWFYILTKPVFNAMNFFYKYVGNFGISILIVTVIIKLAMFTLANKSYQSMKRMKALQPEIERIKARSGDDKVKLNQEIMALYKKEKVNPVSGCLPLLVQIPVFFSIYKVLYVTIEMRHAPFFGWIKDLSAPDPTSIFNLFGLLPLTPPTMLMIGIWPIIMAVSMYLQQRMSPEPADPVQAQVMKLMPLFFLFMFSGFPAGLLIYWSWNNVLSILQQYMINRSSVVNEKLVLLDYDQAPKKELGDNLNKQKNKNKRG